MIKFSEDKLKEVQTIIDRYPEGKQKSALIPLLHLAQEEFALRTVLINIDHHKKITRLCIISFRLKIKQKS